MEKLLAYHDQAAAAIRLTLTLLGEDAHAAKQDTGDSILTQAMALDARRRVSRRTLAPAKTKGPAKRFGLSAIRAQRERSAAYLAQFDPVDPRPSDGGHPATYIAQGYLARKGDGYVRTAKPYVIDAHRGDGTPPPPPPAKHAPVHADPDAYVSKAELTRRHGLAFLSQFSEVPTSVGGHMAGAYVRRGYLKRKGDGYVRTAKPYHQEQA